MDLAELKFVVNTKQLETAADLIKELGDEITKLNAVQKSSTAIAKDEAQAEKIRIKAQTELVELKKKLAQAEDAAATASTAASGRVSNGANAVTRALEKQADVLKITRGQTIEVADGQLTLDRSFRSSQVSALASLKALGATTDQMSLFANTFKELNLAAGFNPLDKMSSGLVQLRQEVKEMSSVDALMRAGINLSRNTMVALSRDIEATTEAMKAEGKTFADIEVVISNLTQEYKNLSQQKELSIRQSNEAAAAARAEAQAVLSAARGGKGPEQPMDSANLAYQKENARLMKESANAAAYLEKEMKRVEFVLDETNATLQLSTSNRLLKFEESLKRTGVTGAQAGVQLDAYRQKLNKIDETRAFKRQTDDLKVYQDKVDYVTRAVGPQLTDIFSGLLTGQQSLYTIAVQQGGQLADQFSLAGIEANKMGGILASALPNMYTNIANIGKAFGQMAIGGITQLGTSITSLAASALIPTKNLQQLRNEMIALDGIANSSSARLRVFDTTLKLLNISSGALVIGIVASFAALAVASYQVIKEETALSKALNTTGASLGFTKNSAVAYAASMSDLGISTSKGIEVISAMSKAGVLGSDAIRMVTESAVEMEKYAGIAIADTVKAFESMKEKPVESLVALAKATGMVAPETIKLVYELENQGRTAEAASIAMNALADANAASAKRIQDDLHPLQQLWISLGNGISAIWNGVKDLTRNDSTAALGKAYERLASYQINPQAHKDSIEAERILISQLSSKIRLEATNTKLRQDQSIAAGNTAKWEEIKIQNLSKEKKEAQEILKVRESGAKVGASEAEIQQQISAIIAKRPKPPKVPESEYSKTMKKATEEYIDIQNKANGVNTQFNNQLERQKFLLQEGKITTEEYAQVVIALTQQQKVYTDEVAKQEKAQRELNKAWDDAVKAQAKKDDDFFKQFDEMTKQRQELEMQTSEIEFQLTLVGKTADEQKVMTREFQLQNKLKNVQVELERELLKIKDEYSKDPASASMLNEEAYRIAAEKIKAINAGVALEFAQDMQREFNSIKATITDAVVTALFDGGKAGSKKLRDAIVAQFRNKITIVVDAVVNTALNSGLSALGLGGSSGGGGSLIGTASDLISISTMGSTLATGFGKIAASSFGQSLGLSTTAGVVGPPTALGAAPTMLTGTGSSISAGLSAAGPYIAAAMAIYSIAKSLDDSGTMHTGALSQYSATGGAATSQTHGAFGMGFGGVDYSEGAQKLTGEISKSIVTMLDATAVTFGKEAGYKAATAFADDSSGDGAWGGLLIQKLDETIINWDTTRSSKWAPREFSNAEAGQKEYLNAIAADTRNALESIGLPTWATKMLDAVGNAPTLESIAAVVDQINATKVALKSLGEVFPELINISDTAIDNLITVFGGLGNFAASLQSYYSNFYTESEQIERATANTSKAFGELGITMPKVDESLRTWYRGIVDSALALDQGDIANAKATASVLALQGAVNELAPAFDEAAIVVDDLVTILEGLTAGVNAAYSQLEASVQAEKRTLQFQLDIASTRESIAQTAVDSLKSIFDTLKQSVKELYQEVDSTSAMQVQQARGVIGASVASGSVNNIDDLKEAIDTVRSSLDSTSYKTKADQDRARLLLANDLAKLQASTEVQLTNEEKILAEAKSQVKMLQEQLKTLDDILEEAKIQVEAIDSTTSAVISVKDAINALSANILTALNIQKEQDAKAIADAKALAVGTYSGLDYKVSPTSVVATPQTESEKAIAAIYQTVLGREADTVGLAWWGSQGYSTSEIYAGIAQSQEAQVRQQYGATGQNAYNTELNNLLGNPNLLIPAYANGGSYKGGMALVGERGPELINFSQPGQVYTASQTSSMMNGGSSLEELVIKLNENIEGLRFEVRADVSHNSKIAKILDRVSPDGQSLSVTVLA